MVKLKGQNIKANSKETKIVVQLFFFQQLQSKFLLSSTMSNNSEDSVNNITMKVPPIFKHSQDTWFAHLEAQFDIRKITISSTSFIGASQPCPSMSPPG